MSTRLGSFPCPGRGSRAWQAPKDTDNGRLTACTPFHTHLAWRVLLCLALGSSSGLPGTSLDSGLGSRARLGSSPWLLPISQQLLCAPVSSLISDYTQENPGISCRHASERLCGLDQLCAGHLLLCSDSGGPFGTVQQDFSLLSAALWWRCCFQACCQEC